MTIHQGSILLGGFSVAASLVAIAHIALSGPQGVATSNACDQEQFAAGVDQFMSGGACIAK
jgi:hypothetical protein